MGREHISIPDACKHKQWHKHVRAIDGSHEDRPCRRVHAQVLLRENKPERACMGTYGYSRPRLRCGLSLGSARLGVSFRTQQPLKPQGRDGRWGGSAVEKAPNGVVAAGVGASKTGPLRPGVRTALW